MTTVTFGQWLVLLVALQRLGELLLSAHNLRRLKAEGAVEIGAGHYPLFVLLHGAWLLAAFLVAGDPEGALSLPLLGLFVLLQGGRLWVLASLGPFWTTRVVTLPGTPLVRGGPYRWLRHPNYLVVALELPVLLLAFGAWRLAVLFGLANLALLAYRIRVEEAALGPRRGLAQDTRFRDPEMS